MIVDEMVRLLLQRIEAAYLVMSDGQTGFVLHEPDYTQFLCMDHDGNGYHGLPRMDMPLSDDVLVYSSRQRAEVMRRYWQHKEGPVTISLRGEALRGYLDVQRDALHLLLNWIEISHSMEKPK